MTNPFGAVIRYITSPLRVIQDRLNDDIAPDAVALAPAPQSGPTRLVLPPTASPLASGIAALISAVSETPLGKTLMEDMGNDLYTLDFRDGTDDALLVDPYARVLYVPNDEVSPGVMARSPYFRHRFFLNVLRGLRAIGHAHRAAMPFCLRPDQSLIAARVQAADGWAIALSLAYDLQVTHPGLWRQARVDERADIAAADVSEQNSAERLATFFHAWYADPVRVMACDQFHLDRLNQIFVTVQNRRLFRGVFTPEDLRAICRDDRLQPYLDAQTILPTLDGLDPIHRAYLGQLTGEQETITMNNVVFRDEELARKIFYT